MFRSSEKSRTIENTDEHLLKRKGSMLCPHYSTEELDKNKEKEIEVNKAVKKKSILKKIFGL